MNRYARRTALVLSTAALLALGACGVPQPGRPIADGGIAKGTGSNQSGEAIIPPVPSTYNDAANLISDGLLYAVAGQTDAKDQIDDVTAFGTTNAKWVSNLAKSKASDSPLLVTVIRLAPDGVKQKAVSAGITQVTVQAYKVGEFDPASGEITPDSGLTTLTYQVQNTPSGLRVSSAPDGLYVIDAVFNDPHSPYYAYETRTIYFWAAGGGMIPDLRYMSRALNARQAATEVVKWLLDPSRPAWMGKNDGEATMPTGTALSDPVLPVDQGTYIIKLKQSQTVSPTEIKQFAAEVAWSLPPSQSGTLQPIELWVNNTRVNTSEAADLMSLNQSWPRSDEPIAFTVTVKGGKVQAVGKASTNGGLQSASVGIGAPADVSRGLRLSAAVTALLGSDENSDVTYAAIHDPSDAPNGDKKDQVAAAFIRTVADKPTLWVSTGDVPNLQPVPMPPGDLTQPHWIPSEQALALLDGGKLYVYVDHRVIPVPVSTGSSSIVAFSIGSDGHRIAYVTSDGRLFIGTLDIDRTSAGPAVVTASSPKQINVRPQLDSATAVAWSSVTSLVVGGPTADQTGQTGQTIEINMDGMYTLASPQLRNYGATAIVGVSSYPLDPLSGFSSPVLVDTPAGSYAGRSSREPLSGIHPFFED